MQATTHNAPLTRTIRRLGLGLALATSLSTGLAAQVQRSDFVGMQIPAAGNWSVHNQGAYSLQLGWPLTLKLKQAYQVHMKGSYTLEPGAYLARVQVRMTNGAPYDLKLSATAPGLSQTMLTPAADFSQDHGAWRSTRPLYFRLAQRSTVDFLFASDSVAKKYGTEFRNFILERARNGSVEKIGYGTNKGGRLDLSAPISGEQLHMTLGVPESDKADFSFLTLGVENRMLNFPGLVSPLHTVPQVWFPRANVRNQNSHTWSFQIPTGLPAGIPFYAQAVTTRGGLIYPSETMRGITGSPVTVSKQTMLKFAPIVWLHGKENHLPSSVYDYLQDADLYDSTWHTVVKKGPLTPADLAQTNGQRFYTRTRKPQPKDSADGPSGAPLQNNECKAPMYVWTSYGADYIDLKYVFFYEFSGFQTFRLCEYFGKRANFVWGRWGRHEGDFEHVTVRINREQTKVLGVFYSAHGHSEFVANPHMNGSRPIVFSALSTHASYPTSGIFKTGEVKEAIAIPNIRWLNVVDICATNEDVKAYRNGTGNKGFVQWMPTSTSDLIDLRSDKTAQKWLNFKGTFGRPETDNTHIDRPASGTPMRDLLFAAVKVFMAEIVKSNRKLVYGRSPRSPKYQHDYWNLKEKK